MRGSTWTTAPTWWKVSRSNLAIASCRTVIALRLRWRQLKKCCESSASFASQEHVAGRSSIGQTPRRCFTASKKYSSAKESSGVDGKTVSHKPALDAEELKTRCFSLRLASASQERNSGDEVRQRPHHLASRNLRWCSGSGHQDHESHLQQ